MSNQTAKARLIALDAGRIEEAKATAREAAVLGAWPESVPVSSVCVHPHHVSATIHDTDPAAIPAMLRALPPVPTTLVKGTFTSFKPSANITEKESDEAKEETPVYPVTVELSGSIGHEYGGYHYCRAQWFTRCAGESVEVHAEFQPYKFAHARADILRRLGGRYGPPAHAEFHPEPVYGSKAQLDKWVKFSSGSYHACTSYNIRLYWLLVPDGTTPGSPAEIWKSNIYPMVEAGEEQAEK